VLTDALTPEMIMQYVAGKVSPHKRVRQVEIIDAIPKSASGKILRRVLIEREQAKQARHTATPDDGAADRADTAP
jgi:acyl-coenzyme A synthetase/AMP-(fatty) acid ligase